MATVDSHQAAAPAIPAEWLAEFEAAARRPLETRFKYAFIKTYKPVLDDARFRAFDTTEEYRQWCDNNLPEWLGFKRVEKSGKHSPVVDTPVDEELPCGAKFSLPAEIV